MADENKKKDSKYVERTGIMVKNQRSGPEWEATIAMFDKYHKQIQTALS